jgi:hypothetical protein
MTNDRDKDNKRPSGGDDSRHLNLETLNAFADNQLSTAEREWASAHLVSCEVCRGELQSLQATTALMKTLPDPQPARSFQLGPEYAAGKDAEKTSWIERLLRGMPALRTATAAIAMLLVVVIAGDVLTNRNNGTTERAAPAVVQTTSTSARAVAPATSTAEASSLFQAPLTEGQSAEPTQAPPSAAQQKESTTESNSAADAAVANTEAAAEKDQIQAAGAAAPQEEPASPPPPNPTATAQPTATIAPTSTPEPTATSTPVPPSSAGTSNNDERNWRIVEVALVLILAWLVVTWIGVEVFKRDSKR